MYNTDLPERQDLPTSAQLLRSTLIALGVAIALLITAILPAEYGVDPTGIGRTLGLTEMGEIKVQLAEEAASEAAGRAELVETTAPPVTTKDIEAAPVPAAIAPEVAAAETTDADAPQWTDTVSLTLEPGAAAEIKLIMNKGATADYEWSVSAGHLNSDLHGNGTEGQSVSYRKGRAETVDADALTAAFDGAHGWFWRNRSDVAVEVTLKVRGDYTQVKRVL
ncbi:transmembrane anchor protein [Exilibacterium tricleocarpae]|uniref:Transmembrane anchor protein n=1 Tax=Exilibacterium tricleocarpae TaxID=2591008 RepID=A0A545STE0_9GAMM|nr:transmembrane anchor protein [Exilibacterium tricleocarpae]TQV68243.1 transmembrane anchor protein [Exilibacterium tricleocarpae]